MFFVGLAVTAVDVCRWIESCEIPFHESLSKLPVWVFEAGGMWDSSRKKLRESKTQRFEAEDKSVFQLHRYINVSRIIIIIIIQIIISIYSLCIIIPVSFYYHHPTSFL